MTRRTIVEATGSTLYQSYHAPDVRQWIIPTPSHLTLGSALLSSGSSPMCTSREVLQSDTSWLTNMVAGFSPRYCISIGARHCILTSKQLALFPRRPQTCQGGGVQAIAGDTEVRCQRGRAFPRLYSAFRQAMAKGSGGLEIAFGLATHWRSFTPWSLAYETPRPR